MEGLNNFEEILQIADGAIISRNDIAAEISAEKVFLAQKWMIDRANALAKPIIIATQVLEGMAECERPDRREAEDVAIAVTDGADALIVAEESSNGKYSIETLNALSRCCADAERTIDFKASLADLKAITSKYAKADDTLAASCVSSALSMAIDCIVVITKSGELARLVAKYRPRVPILACCTDNQVLNFLTVSRGVIPCKIDNSADELVRPQTARSFRKELIRMSLQAAKEKGLVKIGGKVLFVQEEGTDVPIATPDGKPTKGVSHSYKKIVEVTE